MSEYEDIQKKIESGNFTDEDLKALQKSYVQALTEEFAKERKPVEDTEQSEDYIKQHFRKHVPNAAAQIVHLANNAESETVRLNASKYVLEAAKSTEDDDGDPIKKLLSKLVKNDQTSPAPQES